MNGSDKDGDTNMDTDNPIILRNTLNSPTIVCVQRNAEKKIVTEEDIIAANKIAFNDDIGTVTNRVTSMIEVQSGFEPGTKEYETLEYRIMAGQHFQQCTIDRAKGIISKPMPSYWYNIKDTLTNEEDTAEVVKNKEFNNKIVAENKPYFMTYIYPALKKKNSTYLRNSDYGVMLRFGSYGIKSVQELYSYEPKTPEMVDYLTYHERFLPTGCNPCVVNRICRIFENEFDGYMTKRNSQTDFDYSILKSDVGYSKRDYNEVYKVYEAYQANIRNFHQKKDTERLDSFESLQRRNFFIERFKRECEEICTNEQELCDIVIDICYKSENMKQFAWDICGAVILQNLLDSHNNTLRYPKRVKNEEPYDFEYCGEKFIMEEKIVEGVDQS